MNAILISALLAALTVSNILLWIALCAARNDNAELRIIISHVEDELWNRTTDLRMDLNMLYLAQSCGKKKAEKTEL